MSARFARTYDMCDLGGKNVEGKHFKRINEKIPHFWEWHCVQLALPI